MALPYPRLELRWRPTTEKDVDHFPYYEWACDYVLVIHRATVGDCRSNVYNEKTGVDRYAAKPVQYVLNTTYRSSGADPYVGDIPFRDGTHAGWDSIALDIPAYSVYKGKTKRLKPTPEQIKIVQSRMDGSDKGLIVNRRKK